MSSKSVAARAARESARKRIGKFSINSIYKKGPTSGYPECMGLHQTCPQQVENPREPPESCRKCPHFLDSKYYEKQHSDERLKQFHELFSSIKKGTEAVETGPG